MSDESRIDEATKGVSPIFLVGGLLVAATAGSAFFVLPDETPTTTVSSTITIPVGDSAVGQAANSGEKIPDEPTEIVEPEEAPVEPVDPETARPSKLIVGSWRQDYYGERTLTVKADGTATMTILPSGVFAFGFGPKIDLTMFWSVKDGHLDYGVNGGTPDDKVKLAAKTWGDHWVEKIISLDESKLDLLSVDGSSHSIWERVPSDELSEAEGPTP
jgi:hypothetical protein